MFEKCDLSNRQKMKVASFSNLYKKITDGFCLNRKTFFLRSFALKPIEKENFLLRTGIRDF